jgi:hypothetical protein
LGRQVARGEPFESIRDHDSANSLFCPGAGQGCSVLSCPESPLPRPSALYSSRSLLGLLTLSCAFALAKPIHQHRWPLSAAWPCSGHIYSLYIKDAASRFAQRREGGVHVSCLFLPWHVPTVPQVSKRKTATSNFRKIKPQNSGLSARNPAQPRTAASPAGGSRGSAAWGAGTTGLARTAQPGGGRRGFKVRSQTPNVN